MKHQMKDKVALHNAFVLAILGQAYQATPAPEIFSSRAAKGRDKRRPKKAKLAGSLPIKSHLRYLLFVFVWFVFVCFSFFFSNRDTTGLRNPKKMWLGKERGGVSGVALVGQGSSAETREIAQRMKAIADEEGLERVDEEAVTHLQAALHAHLLRLLRAASPSQEVVLAGAKKRERGEETVLEVGALRLAVAKNGKTLLCDDLLLQREKLLLQQE